jgi:hypothetical protein
MIGLVVARHSFTCFFLFGTLWARELAPFLSPSHLQKGAVAPGDHFLLIDVDNCAKVLVRSLLLLCVPHQSCVRTRVSSLSLIFYFYFYFLKK